MPRLIVADEAYKVLTDYYHIRTELQHKALKEAMERVPTVDAEPVRHGRWIKDDTGAEYCSNCHEYPYDDGEYHIANWHSNYCPNCGAKMDEERENAETN